MHPDDLVYIDTNIFILTFENTGMITLLLRQLLAVNTNKPRFATSELTLSELLVKPVRGANKQMIDAYEAVILNSLWLKVLPFGKPVLRHAAFLRAHYPNLKLPDAIHISTAFAAECSHLLTGDTGLKSSYNVTEDEPGARRAPLVILRPDEPTLTALIKSLSE